MLRDALGLSEPQQYIIGRFDWNFREGLEGFFELLAQAA